MSKIIDELLKENTRLRKLLGELVDSMVFGQPYTLTGAQVDRIKALYNDSPPDAYLMDMELSELFQLMHDSVKEHMPEAFKNQFSRDWEALKTAVRARKEIEVPE